MTTTRWSSVTTGAALLLLLLVPQACGVDGVTASESDAAPERAVEATDLRHDGERRGLVRGQAELTVVAGLTVDANGVPILPIAAPPDTPLFYARNGQPILAPDGHQITAGEFSAVRGSIDVSCVDRGTLIRLNLRNLIPHATYRVWLLKFREPGFSIGPPPDFSNLTGEGSLGPNDRSRNTFRASASGHGEIVRIQPAGPLSETLPAPPFANEPAGQCLLTDEFEWHVVAAIQQPGQPAGPDIGPPALNVGTAVEQFVFIFRNMP